MRFRVVLPALLAACCTSLVLAQQAATPPARQTVLQPNAPAAFLTHEVHPDGTITFRYKDASAQKVAVSGDIALHPLEMTRDDNGVWSVTTAVLPPEVYGYTILVDGVQHLDPRNSDVRPNYNSFFSNVTVPATPPAPWEMNAVPHGRVDHITYTTHVAKNMPQNQDSYFVYTPPGYDEHKRGGYPVLYLLHGWSDPETGWIGIGKANMILDKLIADGKAVPMIVVMPLGYGNFDFATHGFAVWQDRAQVVENTNLYEQMLETEVMPAVDSHYNVAKGRENHAIAGLSMGGLETLTVGLHHTDQFAWIAGMSSAIQGERLDEVFPNVDAKKANLKLFWVSCGTSDGLITPNRAFIAWARGKGFDVDAVETPGAHTWVVWRDNLIHIAPLLFR
jgi:enterochelin esterase-like enzyme